MVDSRRRNYSHSFADKYAASGAEAFEPVYQEEL
jgi:hypothetical protein